MKKTMMTAAVAVLALGATAAHSQDGFYIGGSLGVASLDDTTNDGEFSTLFATGEGTTIPAGTELPAGTAVEWETEFDSGSTVSVVAGLRMGDWRFEGEIFNQTNDVDTHTGVLAGGAIDLDGEDAAVLITGQATNLGVSVGDLVADGQGEISQTGVMANAYYDFPTGSAITPFLGAGVGFANVDVDYAPSATGIIDDDDIVFAYQVMGGASLALTEQWELVGAVKYRATQDVEVEADLFPADFEISNSTVIGEIGVRYNF